MRIAIFTLGSRGDVQPYVALAKQAVKRGHSAIICTGQTFEKLIKENGVEFAKAESDLMALLETKEGKNILNNAGKHIMKTMKYMKEVINPAYRKSLDQFWTAAQNLQEKSGSILDCCSKPQLIIPFSVDQPFWANRLFKMGYALKPLYEKTLQVQDLIQSFKDMEISANISSANKIKVLIESERGTDNTIDYLEKIHQNWNLGSNRKVMSY
ncbi:MAG: sterol 3-beta-glucosyltransferase [Lacrimispora sp.]|nr:sterol 3-beta-glucosyltransferase [Lacrimispora sp.]